MKQRAATSGNQTFWYPPSVVITSKKKIVITGEKNITAYLIWDLWHQRVADVPRACE